MKYLVTMLIEATDRPFRLRQAMTDKMMMELYYQLIDIDLTCYQIIYDCVFPPSMLIFRRSIFS